MASLWFGCLASWLSTTDFLYYSRRRVIGVSLMKIQHSEAWAKTSNSSFSLSKKSGLRRFSVRFVSLGKGLIDQKATRSQRIH